MFTPTLFRDRPRSIQVVPGWRRPLCDRGGACGASGLKSTSAVDYPPLRESARASGQRPDDLAPPGAVGFRG